MKNKFNHFLMTIKIIKINLFKKNNNIIVYNINKIFKHLVKK